VWYLCLAGCCSSATQTEHCLCPSTHIFVSRSMCHRPGATLRADGGAEAGCRPDCGVQPGAWCIGLLPARHIPPRVFSRPACSRCLGPFHKRHTFESLRHHEVRLPLSPLLYTQPPILVLLQRTSIPSYHQRRSCRSTTTRCRFAGRQREFAAQWDPSTRVPS
jgi:hypothetical protein